jgi:glutamate formiminotransferase/glutamate formiminotransferase/formiminotetrahydrofolate cyclodeaminase
LGAGRTTERTLLAVPNVSEGRDGRLVDALAGAFASASGVSLLDVHFDGDHHRSVFTLAGPQGSLAESLLAGARVAVESIDVMREAAAGERPGQHPHVGALDVAPIVYLDEHRRGAACAEALVVADRIGEELGVPVFLYGELSASGGGAEGAPRTRAELRRGGVAGLLGRMAAGGGQGDGLRPDFGPPRMHPSAGAALVAARPPLVAFNLVLAPAARIEQAREIAAEIREGGSGGLPGVRVIAVALRGGAAQVSVNVERPFDVPLAAVVQAVRVRAPVARAELVGLAPAKALEGFPEDVELVGFDPMRHVIENALGSIHGAGEANT